MKKKAFVVLGLGFGDEGKGLVTDYLVSQVKDALVVRFNGGHQAGHTVMMPDGTKHVFSHFGAGTFRAAPTLWSRFCTFSPAYFLYEYDALPFVIPKVFIDEFCPVTTHYDVLFNRCDEEARGEKRLGSCGLGFGATMRRHHSDGLRLTAKDLFNRDTLYRKLSEIRTYYRQKFERVLQIKFDQFAHEEEDHRLFAYIEELEVLKKNRVIELVDESLILKCPRWTSHIYEGAQGILLDKDFGNKPFVTQSNTTSKNALDLVKRHTSIPLDEVGIHYVTRSYLTRHGEGPFSTLPSNYTLNHTDLETNLNNRYQGEFKRGFLNLDLLTYSIRRDESYSHGAKKNLVITCIDQLPTETIHFTSNGKSNHIESTKFHKALPFTFESVFHSTSPYSECITRLKT